jgi:WD40 repeat protein
VTETLARAPRVSSTLPDTPYVGLVPYTEADSAFFFGREAEKTIVTANLRAARLTLVYGPSGVGKTSLLQAGVVHDLREQVARTAADAPERAPFAIAVFRSWRDDPLPALMECIRASVQDALGGSELEPWHRGEPVVETLRTWTRHARTVLVVVDQFEDYFLYHPNEVGEETFDAQFPRIVNEPNLRVNFLVSIREDAWAKLDRFEGRIPQLFVNYVRIEYLDRDGAREAVEGPIAEYNRRLPQDEEQYAIEPELVEAVVEAASVGGLSLDEGGNGAAAAGDQVETPFLQLVLERLWRATVETGERELTLATLERLGGPQRIVETHLVDALGRLEPREQAVAAEAFRYLVTRSRRRVVQAVSDLAEWLGKPEEELVPVLEKLASGESGRILRPVPPPPGRESEGARYELFHDVLAEPILDWRRQYEQAREREAEARRQRAVRRRLALIAAGLLVLVVAFAAFAGWALHERGVAATRADVAESQALAARSIRAQSLDPRQSLVLAAQAEDKSKTPQAEEALRRALIAWPKPTVLVPVGRTTYGVDFSPDRQLVATAGGGGAYVWSTAGKPVATLVPKKLVYSARFSPDGRFVVTAGADGAIRVWRVGDWRQLPGRVRILAHHLARAAVTRDGRFLVAGGYPGWPNRVWRFRDGRVGERLTKRDGVGGWIEPDGTARVVDARAAARAARLAEEEAFTFVSSPSGGLFAPAGAFGGTPVYRSTTGKRIATLPEARGAQFSPDGQRLAIRGDETVIWAVGSRRPRAISAGSVRGVAFSPDGRLVVSPSSNKRTARVWDSTSGDLLAELPPRPPRYHYEVTLDDPYPEPSPPGGAAQGSSQAGGGGLGPAFELKPAAGFSPDGGLVATWGRPKGGAQLWLPFGTRELARVRAGSYSPIFSSLLLLPTAVSRDGRLVATAGRNHEIEVWDSRDGRRLSTLRGSTDYVSAIAFNPDGDLLAAASFDTSVRIWRVTDGGLVQALGGHTGRVGGVAFSPDGSLVASASEDGTARIWRLRDGELVRVLREPTGPVTSVSFSADGESVVTAGGKGIARVWSTGSWRQKAVLGPTRPAALVLEAVFSRDGRYVATLDLDAKARIWRSSGGTPIRKLDNVGTIVFSPDGKRLVIGGGDATARIVRTSDGAPVGLLRGHTNTVASARFSPDGDLIVTAGLDGTARVWQAATEGTVAVVTLNQRTLADAMFAVDGRLVIVSDDGVRVYACEQCLQPAPLRALAEQRLALDRQP